MNEKYIYKKISFEKVDQIDGVPCIRAFSYILKNVFSQKIANINIHFFGISFTSLKSSNFYY